MLLPPHVRRWNSHGGGSSIDLPDLTSAGERRTNSCLHQGRQLYLVVVSSSGTRQQASLVHVVSREHCQTSKANLLLFFSTRDRVTFTDQSICHGNKLNIV